MKRTKHYVFSKVESVTHSDKIWMVKGLFILVVLESRDEFSGLYLQNHTWNRERTNGIFGQDLGNCSVAM